MSKPTKKKPAKRSERPKLAVKLADPVKIVQPHGGALLSGGVPGHVGAGGRPKDEFKALCRELASGDLTIDAVRTILGNPAHPQFVAAWRYVTEQGYGKPVESVEVTGKDGGPVEVRQQILIGGVTVVF